MRNLVIGASGLIGSHIYRYLKDLNTETFGTYFSKKTNEMMRLDITSNEDLEKLFLNLKPEIIYVPAAVAGVDYCEKNPSETYLTNVTGLTNIVENNLKQKNPARIVYFSSEYVFDGKKGPYTEQDVPNPINEYGRQKLASEHVLTTKSKNYLIVRTVWVYGREENRKNFMYQIINKSRRNEEILIPKDEYSNPTYVEDIPKAIEKIINKGYTGIINIAGQERMSKSQFAERICDAFELSKENLKNVEGDTLSRPAKRPKNAGLKTDLLKRFGISMTVLGDALEKIKEEGV